MEKFGWCFIGAGSIAHRVYADMHAMDGAYVASVYSRTRERAQAFADKCGATVYDTLEAAIMDERVQAVYVATTNDMHCPHTLAALSLGKPVLCEKPFSINTREAEAMIGAARAKGLYLMEGMWTRFNPAIRQALAWINDGRIGQVRYLTANYAFASGGNAVPRIAEMGYGGGGLLDLGVYTLAIAQFVFGCPPKKLLAAADFMPSGVDRQCAMTFQYDTGAIASLYCGVEARTVNDATIHGERGTIYIPEQFPLPKQAILRTSEGEETFDVGLHGEGFMYEFNAVMADIRAGRLENDLVPHAYTLDIMRTMDAVRGQIGLTFAQDETK